MNDFLTIHQIMILLDEIKFINIKIANSAVDA